MSKVFSAHAVSVDGYTTGRDPGPGCGLADGTMLFDWCAGGDTPSQVFDGFALSEPSARVFDPLARRVGAVGAGRNTYEDSDHRGGDGPDPTSRLFVLSHRPAPEMTEQQTLVNTGIDGAVAAARDAAGRPYFQALPEHARLRLLESVPAPDVTHLHYEVAR
jgi:dihydrofolate reductase